MGYILAKQHRDNTDIQRQRTALPEPDFQARAAMGKTRAIQPHNTSRALRQQDKSGRIHRCNGLSGAVRHVDVGCEGRGWLRAAHVR